MTPGEYWTGQVILASGILLAIRLFIVGPILRALRRQYEALGYIRATLDRLEWVLRRDH